MFVYQSITGYNKSIIDLSISVDDAESGFHVAIGSGDDGGGALAYSGIMFSGYEGYIFDQSGDFVGGYSKDVTFTISTHIHDDDHVSYYLNNDLIKNNYTTITNKPNRIEFEKHGESILYIAHKADSSDAL